MLVNKFTKSLWVRKVSCGLTSWSMRLPTLSPSTFSSHGLSKHKEVIKNRGHLSLYLYSHNLVRKQNVPSWFVRSNIISSNVDWAPLSVRLWEQGQPKVTGDPGYDPTPSVEDPLAAVLIDDLNCFSLILFSVISRSTRPSLGQMIQVYTGIAHAVAVSNSVSFLITCRDSPIRKT